MFLIATTTSGGWINFFTDYKKVLAFLFKIDVDEEQS